MEFHPTLSKSISVWNIYTLVLLWSSDSMALVYTRSFAVHLNNRAVRRLSISRLQSSSFSSSSVEEETHLRVPTAEDMEDMGGLVATFLNFAPPATILLEGDLGAGKTSWTRGFIRAATRDYTLPVTSPTYLLSQTYSGEIMNQEHRIHHMDLYRLHGKHERELIPLDLEQVWATDVCVMEWPIRLSGLKPLPEERLEVNITIPEDSRLTKQGTNDDELERIVVLRPIGERWKNAIQDIVESGAADDWICDC